MAKVKNKRENHDTKRSRYYETRDSGSNQGRRNEPRREPAPERRNEPRREPAPEHSSAPRREENTNIIIGRNPVMEALKNDRQVDKLMVSSRDGSMVKILGIAKERSVPVITVEKAALDRIADGRPHQGVIAFVSPYAYAEMDDIFALAESRGEDPFIIILDDLEDPHNLGAIMRTAECAGAHGVIIPKRHACGLTEAVAKASAGAVEYVPCVKVTNIAQTIDELKERGIWTAACDMGGQPYYRADLTGKLAVVIGSEGAGISKLVKEKCDFTVSMPMMGKISSLNASNAAAVVMYEVRKQRDGNESVAHSDR